MFLIFSLQDASFWDSTYSTYASMTGRIEAIVGFSNGSSWTGNYDIPMHGGERASAFLQWVSCDCLQTDHVTSILAENWSGHIM